MSTYNKKMTTPKTLREVLCICFGYNLVKNLTTIFSTLDEASNIETETDT